MAAPQLFNRVRAEGQVDMKNGRLTQWIAKYGYVPIVLIGMAGLAPEIGAGERKSGDTIVVEAPVVAEPASKGYIITPTRRRIGRRCRCQMRSSPPAPRTTTTYAPRSSRQQCCSMSTCG